jgi:hypothetical protein
MPPVPAAAVAAGLVTQTQGDAMSIQRKLTVGVLGLLVVLGPSLAQAQDRAGGMGGGNFDPEQMRARMAERMQETLGATPEEWTVIEPLWMAVTEAQRSRVGTQMRGMFGGRRGGPGGEQGGPGGAAGGPGMRGFGGAEPAPEVVALQEALAGDDVTPEALKPKLEAFRALRQKQDAALKEAQGKLRAVLSLKQEAILVMQGTLE